MSDRYQFKTRLKSRARPLREHGRQLKPPDHTADYDRAGASIYSTDRWRQLAKKFKRKHPTCSSCGISSNERRLYVDHIVEIKDLPLRANDPDVWAEENLQTLCARCHGAKSYKEQGKRSQAKLIDQLSWLDE